MSLGSQARVVVAALVGILLFSGSALAQTPVKGDISGIVVDQSNAALPGVTVTLTGQNLFQKSLTVVSDREGAFRFLSVTPGEYELEFTIQGMRTVKITGVAVELGLATPVKALMRIAQLHEEVQVVANGPTIEVSRPQVTVNYTTKMIDNLPASTRSYIDVMNASPGINDNTAYGTSGNVSFSGFSTGSMTSAFRFNGVDVSDPAFGYSAISPIYESIEEIQVVGIGASAEYGNFEGAAVNVTTKSGTNQLHGSASAVYTGAGLYGNNSGGVYELRPNDYRYKDEVTGTIGGPIVKGKLFYFAAGGYSTQKWEPRNTTEFMWNKFKRYQVKLDWVVNPNNTLSIMYNGNPAVQHNFYFSAGQAPSASQDYTQSMDTVFGSWRSVLSPRALLDVRFAAYSNVIKATPWYPGMPPYTDNGTGKSYGSGPFDRSIPASRFAVDPVLGLVGWNALGAKHDLKLGLEWDKSRAGEDRVYSGGGSFNSLPLAGNVTQWTAQAGGDMHDMSYISRVGLFAQDEATVGRRLHLSLGLRYERPDITAAKFNGSVMTFNIFSPRVGFAYDVKGDATSVVRASYGLYVNKVLGQTYYPALPGTDNAYVYQATFPTTAFPTFNPNDANSLKQMFTLLTQPQFLYQTYQYSIPATVDPNLKQNGSNVFSVGFDRALGTKTTLSATYLYRNSVNRYDLKSSAQHTYAEVMWTDPWLGNTVPLWQQTDKNPDTNLMLANSSWEKARTQMLMLVLRRQFTRDASIMASYTYQNTLSNLPGNGSSDLFGFPDYNVDTDPQYTQNPLQWGHQWDRPHQFKLSGNYIFPGGFLLSSNFRGVSSVPWQPQVGLSVTNQGQLNLPVGTKIVRTIGSPIILLDTRGSHRGPMTWNLDLRVAKNFKVAQSRSVEIRVDVFNALNAGYYYNVASTPYAVYASTGRPSYGLPTSLFDPRNVQFSMVWKF